MSNGSTWIQTVDGPVRLSDLEGRATSLAGINPSTNQRISVRYQATCTRLYSVRTDRGFSVLVPHNVQFLRQVSRKRLGGVGGGECAETKWVPASRLNDGDVVYLDRQVVTKWGREKMGHGWLVGEIVGDGGFNPDKYPTYLRFWDEIEIRERLVSTAIAIISSIPKAYRAPIPFRGPAVRGKSTTVACRSLDSLAIRYIEPKTKNLLPAIESAGSDFQRGFIRGLFDTDGSVQGQREHGISVRLAQSSLDRLYVVQRILSRFSIISTVYPNRRMANFRKLPDGHGKRRDYYCNTEHELVISRDNAIRYAEEIGFSDSTKFAKLTSLLSGGARGPYQEKFTARVQSVSPIDADDSFEYSVSDCCPFNANGLIVRSV